MKPTQEQVIAWARESGITFQTHQGISGRLRTLTEGSQSIQRIETIVALAYEAGREESRRAVLEEASEWGEIVSRAVEAEREACAKVCEAEEQRILSKQSGRDFDPVDTNLRMIACVLPDIAAAIRAREQS